MFATALTLGIVATFALIGPQFGYSYAVVKSGSMAPAYPVGAVIVVDSVNPNSVVAGDVISFRIPGAKKDEVVTHRVVEVRRDAATLRFQTKGDANEEPDSRLIEGTWVNGRVVYGLPWVGYLAPVVQQKGVFFAIVLLCGGLLIAMELANILREVRTSPEPPIG